MMNRLCERSYLSVVKEEMRSLKMLPDSVAGNQPPLLMALPSYEDDLISQTCSNLGVEGANSRVLQSSSHTCRYLYCSQQLQC